METNDAVETVAQNPVQQTESNPTDPPVKEKPTGPKPITPEQQASLDKLNFVTKNIGQIASQNAQDKNFYTRPYAYNPETTNNQNQNFERYYSHSSFKNLGWNPWQDNETLYNEKGSAWGDVGRATMAAAKLVPTAFTAAIRSYGDIFTGNPLAEDDASAAEMKRLGVIGNSSRGGVTGFTSNLISSAGYTVGMGLEMAAEAGVAALLTPETAGASAVVGVARLTQNVKALGKYFNVVKGFTEAVGTLKNYGAAKVAYNALRGVVDFVNPLNNTVDALKALKTSENLTNLAKVSQTAAAFHRDVLMANASLSEAKVEGATTKSDLEETLIAKYYEDYHRQPGEDELLKIKQTAQEAGDKALYWNLPTLFLTNKITFDPLFKKFTSLDNYITKAGTKFVEKKGEGFVTEGVGTGIKGLLKPKVYGIAGLNYFKGNFSEGLQESLQDIISSTSKNYYTDIYNHPTKQGLDQNKGEQYTPDFNGVLGKSVADQFNGKGFETFASGFFMGGLFKPIGALHGFGKEQYNRIFNKERYAEYKKNKDEYSEKTLKQLNELYKDDIKYFGSGILNLGNASNTIDNQKKAADKGDKKTWQDVDDQNVWSHISTALDTGTYDVFLNKMKAIKTMTPEAIKEAYGVDGAEVLSKINRITDRAEGIKESYAIWNNRASNPFQPKAFKQDTPEYKKEAAAYIAWEQAKKNAIFYGYSLSRNAERIASVQSGLLDTKTFKSMNSLNITPLFNVQDMNKEISLLTQEVSVLKSADTPGLKSDISKKQGQLEKLQDFRAKLEHHFIQQAAEGVPTEEREKYFANFKDYKETTDKDLKESYKNYLKYIATQSDVNYLNDIEVEDSYKAIKDLHTLNSESRNLTETINMLANPKGFYDHYDRMNKIITEMSDNKSEDLKKGIEDTYSRIELNSLLNNLYRMGFVVDQKDIKELIEEGKVPEQFYNVASKQTVTKGNSGDYTTFENIVNDFLSARKGESVVVEAPVAPEAVSDEEYQNFVDNNKVTAARLQSLATKIINKEDLSEREQAIFTGKTTEVNNIIEKRAEEQKVPETVVKPKEKSTTVYNVEARLAEIKTGEDLANYQSSIMAILGDYDRTIELGITLETEKLIFEGLKEKENSLTEGFDPSTLKVGNIVQMTEKRYGKMIVEKVNKENVYLKKLGEDETALMVVKKSKLKNEIKFKYSDTMTIEEQPELSKEEKENAVKNQEGSDNLLSDTAALQALQAAADKEGVKKVTDDFINNLGCK